MGFGEFSEILIQCEEVLKRVNQKLGEKTETSFLLLLPLSLITDLITLKL